MGSYETGNGEDERPVQLQVYKGIRDGDTVRYTGQMPLDGVFVVDEIVQFATEDVLAVIRMKGTAEIYEVNADNLEKLE